MDYAKICFVVMPFGVKSIGRKKIWKFPFSKEQKVNFDDIYENVFVPAIKATKLPEGGYLEPHRTDKDFFSSNISVEMLRYLEYSRFILSDITGLNPNVFWELGFRHRARETGTAIFRQPNAPIPFDINHIKAFPYEYQPEHKVNESKQLITKILTESLEQNRVDSPIGLALLDQRKHVGIESILRDAEDAIRNRDNASAILKYKEALRIDSDNPLLMLKLGLLFKAIGNWREALSYFDSAIIHNPTYSEAYREKGIAENKLLKEAVYPAALPTGEEALNKAIALNSEDFDALSSLGGILKRQDRFEESLAMYRKATEVSNGHSYPLLNEIKVQALLENGLNIDQKRIFFLRRAQRSLEAQVSNVPPYNAPWSFFDLSDIHLFFQEETEFLSLLRQGIAECSLAWQADTHLKSLELLKSSGVDLPGMGEGIALLKEAVIFLPN